MTEVEIQDRLYNAVVERNATEVKRILLQPLDLGGLNYDNNNIIGVAIEKGGGTEVLAEFLRVRDLRKEEEKDAKVSLPKEILDLITEPCDDEGLTPLVKAAKYGNIPAVSLLLSCGADINGTTPEGKIAVDFALDNNNPKMALTLFENDSLFPRKHSLGKVQAFIRSNPELGEFFERTDNIHNLVKTGKFDSGVKTALESSARKSYFINGKGQSLLYSAGESRNYDAWGYFLSEDLRYADEKESKKISQLMKFYPGMFKRSLERSFYRIKGSHVFKMVSKSVSFRVQSLGNDLVKRIEGFFRWLDNEELTSVLLEVLQDVKGFEVAFDFDSSDVHRMCFQYGENVRGLSDDTMNRVYVAAMETKEFDYSRLVSNLAHELAHRSISVVFKNHGFPYEEGDTRLMEEYEKVVKAVLSPERSQISDIIIKRVSGYPEALREQELIVRVPEMVAKYSLQRSGLRGTNGIALLKTQAPELLKYYTENVIPRFREYVRKTLTGDRITGKALVDYQKLLSSPERCDTEISEECSKEISFHRHNRLRILKVSSVQLARSHLRKCFPEGNMLFVDWTQFLRCEDAFMDELMTGEIGTMVITWDERDEVPTFCEEPSCWSEHCPANKFFEYTESVIMLVKDELGVLSEAKGIEYLWSDLSERTKEAILEKTINFGGRKVTLCELFRHLKRSEDEKNFLEDIFDHRALSYLLDENSLQVGKDPALSFELVVKDSFLNNRDCFIERALSQKCFNFESYPFDKEGKDVCFISNCDSAQLHNLGLPKEFVGTWNRENPENKRFYVTDQQTERERSFEVFDEIVEYYNLQGVESKIFFLRLKEGKLLYVKSVECGRCGEFVVNGVTFETPEEFLTSHVVGNITETTDFNSEESIVIAADPGCGKSVFLFSLAMQLKDKLPLSWVAVVDLSVCEHQKNFEDFLKSGSSVFQNPEEILNNVFDMIKVGNSSLEKKLFRRLLKERNKVFVLFDGFDEICPTFKEEVSSFLLALKKSTGMKLFVTTRLQEKFDLERSLNTVTYDLVPFSEEEQIKYFNMYWNSLLNILPPTEKLDKMKKSRAGLWEWKSSNLEGLDISDVIEKLDSILSEWEEMSKVEGKEQLDLQSVARGVIKGSGIFIESGELFTQIPLHAQMLGLTVYEDSFHVGKTRNLAHLYLRFLKLKINLFATEKAKASGNVLSAKFVSLARDGATKLLEKFSASLFLRQEGYEFDASEVDKLLSTGLVTAKEDTHQFVHRTYGEFLFSKWLLRKAKREHVTKFWIEQLYVDEGMSRVILFLEDILRLQCEGPSFPEDEAFPAAQNSMLNAKLSSEERMENIETCIYAMVMDGCSESLHYFIRSFGRRIAKILIEGRTGVSEMPQTTRLSKTLVKFKKMNQRFRYSNALHFAYFCSVDRTLRRGKYGELVKKFFELIEEWNLIEDINNRISQMGFDWLYPEVYFFVGTSIIPPNNDLYNAELLRFLTRHKEVLRETLKNALLVREDRHRAVCQKAAYDMEMVISLAEIVWDSNLVDKPTLAWGEFFFDIWLEVILCGPVEKVRQVWEYVERKMASSEFLLEFFQRKDSKHRNTLMVSMSSWDYESLNFVWKLGGSYMTHQETKNWLFESFGESRGSRCQERHASPHFYKFLTELSSTGFLSQEATFGLLLSKNEFDEHYLLKFPPRKHEEILLQFQRFLPRHLAGLMISDVLKNTTRIYHTIVNGVIGPMGRILDKELKIAVDLQFEDIYTPEEGSRICWLDGGKDETFAERKNLALFLFTADSLKAFAILLHQQLSLDCKHLGRHTVVERLKKPCYSEDKNIPNVLHHLSSHGSPTLLACVHRVISKFMSREDMEELLFQPDEEGNTIFHVSAKWKNLEFSLVSYDLARVLCGYDALWRVHTSRNNAGECVHHLMQKMEGQVCEGPFRMQ